jgi:thiol-disulfide isomerase/thioredoxin
VHSRFLVLFHTPWCRPCAAVKEEYAAAAKVLAAAATSAENEAGVPLAAVDCSKNRETCRALGQRRFPSTLFFESTDLFEADPTAYSGESTASGYVDFVRDKSGQLMPWESPSLRWERNFKVAHLDGETFYDYARATKDFMTVFYAPWCGHCKAFKPDFAKVSGILAKRDVPFGMSAVDCTASRNEALCKEMDVKGFPTTHVFHAELSKVGAASSRPTLTRETYTGARRTGLAEPDLLRTAYRALGLAPPEELEDSGRARAGSDRSSAKPTKAGAGGVPDARERPASWAPNNGSVVHLTEALWSNFRGAHGDKGFMVMFYAPWCKHCKRMKPDYASASEIVLKTHGVSMAAVDCTSAGGKDLCTKHKVRGFPNLQWFTADGDGGIKEGEAYRGGRGEDDLVEWVQRRAEQK